jgi:hypothetical protein
MFVQLHCAAKVGLMPPADLHFSGFSAARLIKGLGGTADLNDLSRSDFLDG